MPQNPYTITFGKEPKLIIPRTLQVEGMVEALDAAGEPSEQVFMVTGPRGSGKTVFMTEVSRKLAQDEKWVVVELNPERDLLNSLAAKLSSENQLSRIFANAKINLSFFGLGLAIDGSAPITDIETALARMLESMDAQGKRLLITIDEVTNTQAMREFAGAFQILLRRNLPVYLLMTGLYQNINELQNVRTLTFLYRAPRVELAPLNIGTISRSYQRTFGIEGDQALKMARLTRGYSFAFQVLGYLVWEHKEFSEEVLDEYRQYLDDYVYDKVWTELSEGDKRLAFGIASTPSGKVADVRAFLGMETNEFNPYRRRLVRKGIVNGTEHGYVRFALPCFEDYVLERYGEADAQ